MAVSRDEIIAQALKAAQDSKFLKNEPKTNKLMACFMIHISENDGATIAKIVERVVACRGEQIDAAIVAEMFDVLRGLGLILVTISNIVTITQAGRELVGNAQFLKLHRPNK